jgi:hypothetical protein
MLKIYFQLNSVGKRLYIQYFNSSYAFTSSAYKKFMGLSKNKKIAPLFFTVAMPTFGCISLQDGKMRAGEGVSANAT